MSTIVSKKSTFFYSKGMFELKIAPENVNFKIFPKTKKQSASSTPWIMTKMSQKMQYRILKIYKCNIA